MRVVPMRCFVIHIRQAQIVAITSSAPPMESGARQGSGIYSQAGAHHETYKHRICQAVEYRVMNRQVLKKHRPT